MAEALHTCSFPQPYARVSLPLPVLIKAPFALIADMLSKDGFEGTEAPGGFHVAHDAHDHHGRSLHNGHRLHNFLLVHLCKEGRQSDGRV